MAGPVRRLALIFLNPVIWSRNSEFQSREFRRAAVHIPVVGSLKLRLPIDRVARVGLPAVIGCGAVAQMTTQ
jgi:hypothetical protein